MEAVKPPPFPAYLVLLLAILPNLIYKDQGIHPRVSRGRRGDTSQSAARILRVSRLRP